MILFESKTGDWFNDCVRALLYFDWNLHQDTVLKDPMGIDQGWQKFVGRKMTAQDIETFIGLACVAGSGITKELTGTLTHTGIMPQRLLDMLRYALRLEARMYVRKLLKSKGEIKVGFGLEEYVARVKELVGTGAISWVDAGISQKLLEDQLIMHRAYTVEYARRTQEWNRRQAEPAQKSTA